jgi:hypothetical protein
MVALIFVVIVVLRMFENGELREKLIWMLENIA